MSGNHNMYCSANGEDNMFLTLADYIRAIDRRFEEYNKCSTKRKEVDCQGDDKHKLEEYDNVNKPKHYMLFPEHNIEVRDLMKLLAGQLDYEGYSAMLISDYIQAMQYLLRWHNKNGIEDVRKAKWYLDKIIEELDNGDSL